MVVSLEVFYPRLISVYKPEPIYSYLQIIRNRKDIRFNDPEYNFDTLKLIKINDKFLLELMRSELNKYIFRNKIDKFICQLSQIKLLIKIYLL